MWCLLHWLDWLSRLLCAYARLRLRRSTGRLLHLRLSGDNLGSNFIRPGDDHSTVGQRNGLAASDRFALACNKCPVCAFVDHQKRTGLMHNAGVDGGENAIGIGQHPVAFL
ncbi:hypothetical protein GCM10009077_33280 [Roseibium denhamense]